MNEKTLVYGVGINDGESIQQIKEVIGRHADGRKILKVWVCPFYAKWKAMLSRCYSDNYQYVGNSYFECRVSDDWLRFSNFKIWMEKQDWEGKELDKDLLVEGNKLYSKETCCFIDRKVNAFLKENILTRGGNPIGVYWNVNKSKYHAQCRSVETGTVQYLGQYLSAEEGHQAWLKYKLSQAKILAEQQTNPDIAKALLKRYENYENEEA